MTAGLPGVAVKSSLVRRLAGVFKVNCRIRRPALAVSSSAWLRADGWFYPKALGCLRRARGAWILSALVLASCGGDDGGQSASVSGAPGDPPVSENGRPTISGTAQLEVLAGSVYEFAPIASDPDGDLLTFTIENRPAWASFDPSTGQLAGTPEDGDLGTYAGIRISVTDGEAVASLAAFSVSVVATSTGTATVTWTPPAQKTDGSPLTLAGYKIYWGTASRNYTNSVTVESPGIAAYVIDELTPATWYFAVTAIGANGVESDYSNEATKEIL